LLGRPGYAIMRRAIAWRAHKPDERLAIAEKERGRMCKSSARRFRRVVLELATSLLELRRKAEAENAGVPQLSPSRRQACGPAGELPISVPAEDEAFVAELLNGLLDERRCSPPMVSGPDAIWSSAAGRRPIALTGRASCPCWGSPLSAQDRHVFATPEALGCQVARACRCSQLFAPIREQVFRIFSVRTEFRPKLRT